MLTVHAASGTTSCAPIESHPDYAVIKRTVDIETEVLNYDLEASRWGSKLLATIMSNAAQLAGGNK